MFKDSHTIIVTPILCGGVLTPINGDTYELITYAQEEPQSKTSFILRFFLLTTTYTTTYQMGMEVNLNNVYIGYIQHIKSDR